MNGFPHSKFLNLMKVSDELDGHVSLASAKRRCSTRSVGDLLGPTACLEAVT